MVEDLRKAKEVGCPREQVKSFLMCGYVPQPHQSSFHAATRLCDLPGGPEEIGMGGARGPGKSHAMLAQIALDDCQRVPELKALLLRKVGKAVRELFEDLRREVLCGIAHTYNKSSGVLIFPNGSRVILGHFKNESDIDNYLGLGYDLIGLEEATTLTSSKHKNIGTCLRTSKKNWRPRMYTNANPGGVGHAWYKQLYIIPHRLGKENGTRFFPSTVDDNRYINIEYERWLNKLTGWQKRAWRYGDWDVHAGQFFTTFNPDVHVIDPFDIPDYWDVWLSMDYGYKHWNITHVLAKGGDGDIYVIGEHAAREQLVPQVANGVRAMLSELGYTPDDMRVKVAGADIFAERGSSKETIADQWAAEGFDFQRADWSRINGAGTLLKRLGDVENDIQPSLYMFRHCEHLQLCLPMLEHNPRRPEDVLKCDTDEDGIGGDDAYDSCRYGVMEADSLPLVEIVYGESPLDWYGR